MPIDTSLATSSGTAVDAANLDPNVVASIDATESNLNLQESVDSSLSIEPSFGAWLFTGVSDVLGRIRRGEWDTPQIKQDFDTAMGVAEQLFNAKKGVLDAHAAQDQNFKESYEALAEELKDLKGTTAGTAQENLPKLQQATATLNGLISEAQGSYLNTRNVMTGLALLGGLAAVYRQREPLQRAYRTRRDAAAQVVQQPQAPVVVQQPQAPVVVQQPQAQAPVVPAAPAAPVVPAFQQKPLSRWEEYKAQNPGVSDAQLKLQARKNGLTF